MPVDSAAFALLHAARAVAAVFAGRNLDDSLAEMLVGANWPAATRGAVQDLVYCTLRDFGRGDHHLGCLLHKPLDERLAHALLLVALQRLETHGDTAYTTVDQSVAAAATIARGGLKGLVNAVLRNFLRQHQELRSAADADEVARLRHPRWWIDKLRQDCAQLAPSRDADAALAAGNLHPPMCLRVNRRRGDIALQLEALNRAGIAARVLDAGTLPAGEPILLRQPLPVARLPGFAEGRVSVQDAGAQQAAHLLDLAAGQRVLDACAAPGGKSAHILELADVHLTAVEIDATRAARMAENLARLGLSAELKVADCRDPAHWWNGRPYDRILADVPCSASGVARRHPDIKWLRRESDIAQFAAQQSTILDALWQVLVPGGKILYATCSVFQQENQQQVAAFCKRHEDCVRLPLAGAADLLLLPTALNDGFYYALLTKRC